MDSVYNSYYNETFFQIVLHAHQGQRRGSKCWGGGGGGGGGGRALDQVVNLHNYIIIYIYIYMPMAPENLVTFLRHSGGCLCNVL